MLFTSEIGLMYDINGSSANGKSGFQEQCRYCLVSHS